MSSAEAIEQSKARLESLLAPINGGVGEDVSYDEAFDAVKNEVEKLQSLAGGKVDWGQIASTSEELLTDKSKDFRLALYWAAAKAQTEGLQGLLDGLVLVQGLNTAFWDTMYPALKRPKARGNLCGWYSDLVTAKFTGTQPGAKDGDVVKAIDEVLRDVDGTLAEKLGEAYSSMQALRNLWRSVVASVPKEAPPPPPPQPQAAPQPQAQAARPAQAAPPPQAQSTAPSDVAASAPSAGALGSVDDALRVAAECGQTLLQVAAYLREQDPTNQAAYRLMRSGLWMEIHDLPDVRDGKTFVPPPPNELKEEWEGLIAGNKYLDAIKAIEASAAESVFWLDPHRILAQAMDKAGGMFANARRAVVAELGALLKRLPDLPNLQFRDGTTFADATTKMWLETELAASGGGASASNGASNGSSSSALEAPLAAARALVVEGKLPDAVILLAKATAAAPSPVERFRGKLAVAKLCLQAEQYAIARAQLEALDRLAEHHRLDQWEPELCADLYASLYAALKKLNEAEEPTVEARARETAAFDRLCQLDAGAALKLASGEAS